MQVGEQAGAEDGVIEAVVVAAEEEMRSGFAAEAEAEIAHAPFDDGVAAGREKRLAAMGPDVLDGGEGHFDIDEDALAGMAGQDIAGEDGEDFIGLVADALFIDHAEAIGIAVPGDTEVGAVAADFGGQVGHGGGILGIGQVMGKGAVEVDIEADHLAADALQRLGAGHRRDAVAGVRHDLERSGQGEPASQERPILLFGVAGGEGAGAAFEIAAVREAGAPPGFRRRTKGSPAAPAVSCRS